MTRDDWNIFIWIGLLIILLGLARAGQAQEVRPFDKPYWSAVAITGAGVAADAWSTVAKTHFSRYGENNPMHFCNAETGNPWLYGEKPSAGRIAATMAGEFALTVVSSHFLRKHAKAGRGLRGMGYLWIVPLAWEAEAHWRGAVGNWENCR